MSGHSPAISLRAIRTGSWLAPEAPLTRSAWRRRVWRDRRRIVAGSVGAFGAPVACARTRRRLPIRHHPVSRLSAASKSPAANTRRSPGLTSLAGATTIISRPSRRFASAARRSLAQTQAARRSEGARHVVARALPRRQSARASPTAPRPRRSSSEHFRPLRISRLGEDDGFVTGYYEPIIDGSRTQNRRLHCAGLSPPVEPVRARHSGKSAPSLPNSGPGVSQDRPPQAGALLRSRRNRGWRDRRPRPRNLLAQEPDRSAVHRKSRARRASGSRTARPFASITMRITAIPTRRSAAS